MTHEEALAIMEDEWGEVGVLALEASCLTQEDYDKGIHHVRDLVQPALEELLSGDNL